MRYEDLKLVQVTHLAGQLENEGIQNLIQRGYPAYALVVKKGQQLSISTVTAIIQGFISYQFRSSVSIDGLFMHQNIHINHVSFMYKLLNLNRCANLGDSQKSGTFR